MENQNPRVPLSSNISWDDFELTSIPDNAPPVPSLISNLLVGQIKNNPIKDNGTPDADKENFLVRKFVPRRIFSSDEVGTPNSRMYVDIFKRPNIPCDPESPSCTKRIKSVSHGELPLSDGMRNRNSINVMDEDASSEDDPSDVDMDKSWEGPSMTSAKTFQKRSQSDSAVSIMKAVERIDSDSLLIGDASRRYILPIMPKGKHSDLKEISGDTLIRLMNGQYKDLIHDFEIIDCRYPYEYEGGHIRGAINLHTQKQIHEKYLQNKTAKPHEPSTLSKERHILVFHCEFSSQRAPELCRFLRKVDRQCNLNSFPSLHYPELYVLYGGYKAFFAVHKDYCEPQQYLEMADPHHIEDCRWHKNKSKTDLVCTKSSSAVAPKMQRKTNLKKFCL